VFSKIRINPSNHSQSTRLTIIETNTNKMIYNKTVTNALSTSEIHFDVFLANAMSKYTVSLKSSNGENIVPQELSYYDIGNFCYKSTCYDEMKLLQFLESDGTCKTVKKQLLDMNLNFSQCLGKKIRLFYMLIFHVNRESKLIFDSFVLIFYVNKWGIP